MSRQQTQSNPQLNKILLDYTKSVLRDVKNLTHETDDDAIRNRIIEASIAHFQQKVGNHRLQSSRKLALESLLSLYQYLMNPMLSQEDRNGLSAEQLCKDFGWPAETVTVFKKYFPQLRKNSVKGTHGAIDFSKFFALGLLLASRAHSFADVLSNSFVLFSGELEETSLSNKKIPVALLKKCLDWYDALLQNDQKDRMIYDCFMMGLDGAGGMLTRGELEGILREVVQHVESEMRAMEAA